jgi:hypothetical protein
VVNIETRTRPALLSSDIRIRKQKNRTVDCNTQTFWCPRRGKGQPTEHPYPCLRNTLANCPENFPRDTLSVHCSLRTQTYLSTFHGKSLPSYLRTIPLFKWYQYQAPRQRISPSLSTNTENIPSDGYGRWCSRTVLAKAPPGLRLAILQARQIKILG